MQHTCLWSLKQRVKQVPAVMVDFKGLNWPLSFVFFQCFLTGHQESSSLQPCSIGGGSCPAMCTCSNNIVDCRGKGLTAIPANLPDNMAEMWVEFLPSNQIYLLWFRLKTNTFSQIKGYVSLFNAVWIKFSYNTGHFLKKSNMPTQYKNFRLRLLLLSGQMAMNHVWVLGSHPMLSSPTSVWALTVNSAHSEL